MNISILGATGYTGFELLKLILKHPKFNLVGATSENQIGKTIDEIYPSIQGLSEIKLIATDPDHIADISDAIFCCLPHSASMDTVAKLYSKGKIVIDLSADFRMDNASLYESTYGVKHTAPELLNTAIYGIPELFRDDISKSKLIASPGCYPTSIIIPLYPLIKESAIDTTLLIADSKSGLSGAGRKASLATSFCEVNGSCRPYGILTHRHNVEIDHILSKIGTEISLTFTPHLIPAARGLLSTIYSRSDRSIDELYSILMSYYKNDRLVRIKADGSVPDIKNVANTPFIDISLFKKDNKLIIISAIDNLLKGASAQSLQSLNIIAGIDEYTGLL